MNRSQRRKVPLSRFDPVSNLNRAAISGSGRCSRCLTLRSNKNDSLYGSNARESGDKLETVA
jgi:hypothetical protein